VGYVAHGGDAVLSTLTVLSALVVGQAAIPAGSGQVEVEVGGTTLDLFTYKPAAYRDGPLIMVFHGVLRNADEYRDHAAKMGDRTKALVVAPRFDEKRFPTAKYQQGGLLVEGQAAPRDEWTWSRIPEIAAAMRRLEQRDDMPYYLIGHSGGGQFLVRLAGFVDSGAVRIVAANPGTHLFPSRDHDYPYGFGGLPDALNGDEMLKRYLARPLTIYLGSNDTERDEHFDVRPPAERQGKTRYERGRNAFRHGQELARQRGWEFNWRLVEAEGVGHDHEGMFNHAQCDVALFGKRLSATDGK
jgi:pimeloyl-ACP methyl ester carboxylesterase